MGGTVKTIPCCLAEAVRGKGSRVGRNEIEGGDGVGGERVDGERFFAAQNYRL